MAQQQQQPPSSSICETIEQNTIQNFGDGPKKPDKSYTVIWKNFQHWVQDKPCLSFPPYLTQDLVDLYFMEVVVIKNIGHPHACKHVSALQFFADNELTEHAGKESRFIVDGLVLNQALDCQQQKHKVNSLSKLTCT